MSARHPLERLEKRRLLAGLPSMYIGDVSIAEGDAGTKNASVVVSLSHPRPKQTVTVKFATQDGTAAAGSDYTATFGALSFPPGEDSKTILVPVIGDQLSESDESFFINLQSAKQAKIADAQATVTIVDDDPRVSIGDASVDEGHAGTTLANFTVTLSGGAQEVVTVDYATQDGTALAGVDYQAASGTLTFAVGETSKTVPVQVIGDRIGEADKYYFVNLQGGNAILADAQGLGTIRDDEPRISMDGVYDYEGSSGTTTPFLFTVRLSRIYDQPVTVNFATQDYDAIAGVDYIAKSGSLTFAAGDTEETITVQVLGNDTAEPDKYFLVNLSSASANALLSSSLAYGSIADDDGYYDYWYYDYYYFDYYYYDYYYW
jgi:large repetitive protein